jgi:hypothetical protein
MKGKLFKTLWIPPMAVACWFYATWANTPAFYAVAVLGMIGWLTKVVNVLTRNWGKDE